MTYRLVRLEELYLEPARNGVFKSKPFQGSGTPVLKMSEVFNNRVIRPDEFALDMFELSESEKVKFLIKDQDLLFSRTSIVADGVGKCSIVRSTSSEVAYESNIIRVRIDPIKANPIYLFYWFNTPLGRGKILAIGGGAAVRTIKSSSLKSVQVSVPSIDIQKKVVHILSAYDELIENNRRRMVLLEEAARQLHREWFVRLRFPGHEHTRIVNGVPEGWERKPLSQVAVINQDSIPSGYDGEIQYIDISSVTRGSINRISRYNFKEAPSRARRVVQHGDIIWSCVRPNRRSYAVIWQPESNLIVSTGFAVIRPRQLNTSFLLQATTTDSFVGYLENHARGAAYPAVVASDFERAEIFVPAPGVLSAFNNFAEPLLCQAQNLQIQNDRLRAARDLLLPRLMSGEIAV